MRRWTSIAKATALEVLSEPLSLLLLLAALTLATLAPAFHCHQFGEATRMARDAGFSALLLGGLSVAVFGTVRSFRREIESGTVQMALAHPISRTTFFLAKTAGAAVACLAFCSIVLLTLLTLVNGAAIGGEIAATSGEIAKIWGPSLAIGTATMLVPLCVAAVLNRFAGCRFVLTFFGVALVISAGGAFYRLNPGLAVRLAPVAALVLALVLAFLALAAAAAVRLQAKGAVSTAGAGLAAALPIIGNYYLPDALAKGGELGWGYVGWAVLALVPAITAFLLVGAWLCKGKDMA